MPTTKDELKRYKAYLLQQAITVKDETQGLQEASSREINLGVELAVEIENIINNDVEAHGPLLNATVASLLGSAAVGMMVNRMDLPEEYLRQMFTAIIRKNFELRSFPTALPSNGVTH